ncbi:hypothetical protein KO566_05830 [Flavobacteriaceae bacterium XHP0103]|uniref:hypothetical protein n=1 Tax=Marixanthotalea marina TaxID=2844359 RepID=UPI002989CCBD|nr:hypothetical protein [Marixanthotalea marina]MBU3821572.1 hypothetical protein [Marixanthotalea marina]
MKTNYLLPNKYKTLGWFLLLFGIISGIMLLPGMYEQESLRFKVLSVVYEPFWDSKPIEVFKIMKNNISDEIVSFTIIIGGLIVGFTKEKVEDEFIYKLRKDSLVWAIIFNYAFLLFLIPFIYGTLFLEIMKYNMFTPLIFFIIRFNFLKHKARSDEE